MPWEEDTTNPWARNIYLSPKTQITSMCSAPIPDCLLGNSHFKPLRLLCSSPPRILYPVACLPYARCKGRAEEEPRNLSRRCVLFALKPSSIQRKRPVAVILCFSLVRLPHIQTTTTRDNKECSEGLPGRVTIPDNFSWTALISTTQ